MRGGPLVVSRINARHRCEGGSVRRGLAQYGSDGDNDAVERAAKEQVYTLTSEFPIYR